MKRVLGLMGSWVMCAIQIHQSVEETDRKKKEREREIYKKEESWNLRTLKEMSVQGLSRSCAWLNSGQPLCTLLFPESMTLPKGEKHHFIILCHSHPLFPCQTCHMSPSQGVLPAYRVWQGHSHTAPNHTLSPAGRILLWRHRAVMDCQGEGSDFHRVAPQIAREYKEDRECNKWEWVVPESKGEAVMIMWPKEQFFSQHYMLWHHITFNIVYDL